jgi:hypothetical protein
VIGHCDWLAGNLRWNGDELLVVHDWDSVTADSEAVLVGFAAALYSTASADELATVEDTERFLVAYCHARGRELSAGELQRSWAAGVWTRAYDAKYQHAVGKPITSLSENEARERLRRAGTGSRRPQTTCRVRPNVADDQGVDRPAVGPVTTIAWRLAHLIDVFGPPTASHFDGPRAADLTVDYSGTAEGALRQLDEGHDAWVRDVRRLGAAGLVRPQGSMSPPEYADAPMARLVLYTHGEVIHHGAEICLLRDLYPWNDNQ